MSLWLSLTNWRAHSVASLHQTVGIGDCFDSSAERIVGNDVTKRTVPNQISCIFSFIPFFPIFVFICLLISINDSRYLHENNGCILCAVNQSKCSWSWPSGEDGTLSLTNFSNCSWTEARSSKVKRQSRLLLTVPAVSSSSISIQMTQNISDGENRPMRILANNKIKWK